MSNPFNPDRFLYQDSHQPAPYKSTQPSSRQESKTSSHSIGFSPHHDHPCPEILPETSAQDPLSNGAIEAASTRRGHKDSGFRAGPYTVLRGLCALLIVVAAYILGGWVERSSLPSPTATDILPEITAYIDQAVLRLSRDSVGLRDFALYANGGRVIRDLTGVPMDNNLVLSPTDNSPNASLVDDLRVGSCWKFPGEAGQLGFRTSEMIYPTHITVDHIPLEIAADIGQAPRSMALWAAIDGSRNMETLSNISARPPSRIPHHLSRSQPRFDENLTFILLTNFTYDIYSPKNIQTFPIECIVVDARIFFGVFILDIFSNWGGEATCLYRVRIHGDSALV